MRPTWLDCWPRSYRCAVRIPLPPPITDFYLLDAVINRDWEAFKNIFAQIILPAPLLGYFSLAYISPMTRSFMLNEHSQESIVSARAKGMLESS